MARPRSFDNFPSLLRTEYGPYMGVIDRWHDGDTVLVQLDPGFDEQPCRWIRLQNVFAPELSQAHGNDLLAFAQGAFPPGTPCRVFTSKTPVSGQQVRSFERYVGIVQVTDGTQIISVNDAIFAEVERITAA